MNPWHLATRNWLRGLRAGRLTVLMVALTVLYFNSAMTPTNAWLAEMKSHS